MSPRASLAVAPDPTGNAEPVRVATYTRISTDEERQPNSLEAQRVRLECICDQPARAGGSSGATRTSSRGP